ncbi:MAG: hypothetical protein ACQEXQ_30150 [Bacillota bacterium]
MKKNLCLICLALVLTISVYFNFRYAKEDIQETEDFIAEYARQLTRIEELDSGLKGNSPLYYYLESVGEALAMGKLIQLQPKYRENGYVQIYTDVPIDMRLLFTHAYESSDRVQELQIFYEIQKILSSHLNDDVIKDPKQYYYEYLSVQSEIRKRELLDDKTAATLLGW